jgi:FtsH-binding integral membrane protein
MPLTAHTRPIAGAVATQGVNTRVDFLRKTYAHLALAVAAWVGVIYVFMYQMNETSFQFARWALTGRWSWGIVLLAFMAVGWIAERMALSETSRGVQYLGLALAVVAQGVIITPLLYVAMAQTGDMSLIQNAALLTVLIFAGLTATVFITKKDFSFLRGALMIGAFAALGLIGASILFGFSLGLLFSVGMIVLLAGYVLYQTSLVMAHFPPAYYVSAALMLFSTIATLFWYVLRLLMAINRR